MIKITDPSKCCGCTACQAVCPKDAIIMKPDALGFLYPQVDADKCVDCGLCEKVCDFSSRYPQSISDNFTMDVYAVRHQDPDVVANSQSGGAFSVLSSSILSEGGVVYGAVINEDFTVSHVRASTEAERDKMRGSKYVQSDVGNSFCQIKEDLKEGRTVMFCGTPCQVAGLKSYMPLTLQDKLLTVDFVCHGVPSPAIWKDYVAYRRGKKVLEKVCFRDKVCGWKSCVESFVYADGEKRFYKTFSTLFYKGVMLRDSCFGCPYNISERSSDITISDFWGVAEVCKPYAGPEGTSMVVCHTAKGNELFDKVSEAMKYLKVEVDPDFMLRHNPNMLRPTQIPHDRELFVKSYSNNGFLCIARRWSDIGFRNILRKINRKIKRIFNVK